MNQSLNKRKNNNIKFDNSPENFQTNMNDINNLGYYNYANAHKKSQSKKKTKMPKQKS